MDFLPPTAPSLVFARPISLLSIRVLLSQCANFVEFRNG